MPAVGLAVADRRHDARRLARLEDSDHGIRLCPNKIGIDEVITAAWRSIEHRDAPSVRPLLNPPLEVFGNVAQDLAAHRINLPIGVEEADRALGLLERLNQTVEQNAIEAPVVPANAVLVMF